MRALHTTALILSKKEIGSIARRRNEFEHKVNARGAHPADFTRYVEYESNLDALRRRRMKRVGLKSTLYTGQRRIFFILDRATQRFQGDLGLWMQYVNFARSQKSGKKVAEILTRILRLHPTKPELWIYAANYTMEEKGDMLEARSYMQRGLRFCERSNDLWLEYARLELLYVAKILARRRILGLDHRADPPAAGHPPAEAKESEDDVIALPTITADEVGFGDSTPMADQQLLEKLDTNPALSGAIPMAVFDAGYKKLGSEAFALAFFDMVADFVELPCQHTTLEHILEETRAASQPSDPALSFRFVQQPTIGISVHSPAFPAAFGRSLSRMKLSERSQMEDNPGRAFKRHMIDWILPYLEEDLDPDLRKALEMTLEPLRDRCDLDGLEDLESGARLKKTKRKA